MIFFIETKYFKLHAYWLALRKLRNGAAMTRLCHLRNTSSRSPDKRCEFS